MKIRKFKQSTEKVEKVAETKIRNPQLDVLILKDQCLLVMIGIIVRDGIVQGVGIDHFRCPLVGFTFEKQEVLVGRNDLLPYPESPAFPANYANCNRSIQLQHR